MAETLLRRPQELVMVQRLIHHEGQLPILAREAREKGTFEKGARIDQRALAAQARNTSSSENQRTCAGISTTKVSAQEETIAATNTPQMPLQAG